MKLIKPLNKNYHDFDYPLEEKEMTERSREELCSEIVVLRQARIDLDRANFELKKENASLKSKLKEMEIIREALINKIKSLT